MKKRLLSLLLAIVMVLGLLPAMAPAANAASANSVVFKSEDDHEVRVYSGQYYESGSEESTDVKPEDNYAYFKDDTLILHNFVTGYDPDILYRRVVIGSEYGYSYLNIVLEGTNYFDTGAEASIASNVELIFKGSGSLTGNTVNRIIKAPSVKFNGGEITLKSTFASAIVLNKSCIIDGAKVTIHAGGSDASGINFYKSVVGAEDYTFSFVSGSLSIKAAEVMSFTYQSRPAMLISDGTFGRVLEDGSSTLKDYYEDLPCWNMGFLVTELYLYKASMLEQVPKMTPGITNYDLGTVSARSYPIIMKGCGMPDGMYNEGCRETEYLEIKNSSNKTVFSKENDANNSKGISYDMNNLPAGKYTIKMTLIGRDGKGKIKSSVEHTFTIDWTPSVVPYVIAKSTEPIAGTVNTAPTITFDPEFHCKVSDYMTGYWMYYDEKAGYKKKMEANTKFQVDEDYYYVVAVETTDGYTFPADGGEVTGIVMCDSATYAVQTDRVAGRDDVVIMTIWYYPCTYGAPLEFSEQTPVAEFTGGLYEMEGILGQEYLFRFNHKPLTDTQKAKGFSVERTLTVFEGSLSNVVYNVANDTGTQPLSYNLTIDQAQNYLVSMMITLKKDGTTLHSKGGVYLIRVVAGGTPVIFTPDSSNSFGGTVTVDIDAMAKKDANLKTALDNGTVKYQWYRGASQIPGADGQSYTFHADDVGKKIKVAVLYGNSGSISEPFEVGGTAPAFTKQPTGGNVAPDKTMTVKWATNFTPTKIVVDKYNFVGLASEYTTLSGTATSTELPANEHGYVIKAYYNEKDFITSDKFTVNEVDFVNPFTDVKEGDYFYEPVLWAVQNGITTGATATTFNPGGNCLRAHVVTFLHRANGSPEPTTTSNPFTDVKPGDFFYKPVLWAVGKGITNGTSATTFGSAAVCNRASVVTFLWRNAGSPEPKSTNNPFVDVKSTDFFYKAVLWAVEEGITNGLDATHFGPATNCIRAQVVTFLYRAYNG